MKSKLIIGFMGLATAGKSTAAHMLAAIAPDLIKVHAFAAPLKEAAKALFLLTPEQLYTAKKMEVDPRWGKSPREILQLLGTEFVRNMIMQDFWVTRMELTLQYSPHPIAIIDDVRFRDEAQLIIDRGGHLVNVDRLGLWVGADSHSSERPPIDLANEVIYNDLDLPTFNKTVLGSRAAQLIKENLQVC